MNEKTKLLAFVILFCFGCATNKNFNAEDAAIKKGRELYSLLMQNKSDALYGMMTTDFKTAVKGKDGFEKLLVQLPEQLGKELTVTNEAVFEESGFTSYYRISQFEKSASVTTRFIWKGAELHGMNVRPTVQPAASPYLNYETKTALQLPFSDTWYVAWGGREPHLNYHVVAPDQRFAYDFIYSEKGKFSIESPSRNEDYFGYGKPVFAPAPGKVIVAVDTVSDNLLGRVNSKSPTGNYVVLDHGNGEYSLLAHFKKGTIAVQQGSLVKEGDLLGACGNSGQSTLPHLHYHLQTGKDYKDGLGLPALFRNYKVDNKKIVLGEPLRGQYVSPFN